MDANNSLKKIGPSVLAWSKDHGDLPPPLTHTTSATRPSEERSGQSRHSRAGAFTLIELIVVIGIIVLLVAVLLPALTETKKRARLIDCMDNLKLVGLSFRLWSGDSMDRMPMAETVSRGGTQEVANDVWRTFLVMSNELATPKILFCPADNRKPAASWTTLANSNISYFICLNAEEVTPEVLLTGDRNLTNHQAPANRVLTLASNDVVGWTDAIHDQCGNIGLSDGSVQQLDQVKLRQQVSRSFLDLSRSREHLTNQPPLTLRLAMPE